MKLRDAKLRSSCPERFYKKGVLGNFGKFTGKHLCLRLFFYKVAGLACNFFKKRVSGTCVFLWILRNFQEHLFYRTNPVAASANCKLTKKTLSHILCHVFCLRFLRMHDFSQNTSRLLLPKRLWKCESTQFSFRKYKRKVVLLKKQSPGGAL